MKTLHIASLVLAAAAAGCDLSPWGPLTGNSVSDVDPGGFLPDATAVPWEDLSGSLLFTVTKDVPQSRHPDKGSVLVLLDAEKRTVRAVAATDVFRFFSHPDLSPDRTRVAYTYEGSVVGPVDVYSVRVGARTLTCLFDDCGTPHFDDPRVRESRPSWSPGGRLAYVRQDSVGRPRVFVESTPAHHHGWVGYAPLTWSTEGSLIALLEDASDGVPSGLFEIDLATGALELLAALPASSQATLSPDGSRLAFVDEGGIWVSPSDQPDRASWLARGSHPTWSPDGRRIAFYALDELRPEELLQGARHKPYLYVVHADGGAPSLVAFLHSTSPSWASWR